MNTLAAKENYNVTKTARGMDVNLANNYIVQVKNPGRLLCVIRFDGSCYIMVTLRRLTG